jgi:rare lipoprotein A
MRLTIEQKGLLGASLMALAGLYAAFAGGAENQSFLTAPISQAIAAEEPVDVKVQASPAAEEAEEYDEVGYASWYGDELAGRKTASGEPFLPTGISAAHRTLPFQSYVEVTSLDTGRTILVRINDRGPYARSRLIDLSRGAAEQLGVSGHGHAAVRVRRVDPLEQEKVALKQGLRASERLEAPELLLAALRKKLDYTPRTDASSAKSPRPFPARNVHRARPSGAVVLLMKHPTACGGCAWVLTKADTKRRTALHRQPSRGFKARGSW